MGKVYWLGVVGSRQRRDQNVIRMIIRRRVAELQAQGHTVGILSGGARGPDSWAEHVARADGLRLVVQLPNLEALKEGAPRWAWANRYHARNKAIAQQCDELLAFVAHHRTGGTEHTITQANGLGKPVRIALPGNWVLSAPLPSVGEKGTTAKTQ